MHAFRNILGNCSQGSRISGSPSVRGDNPVASDSSQVVSAVWNIKHTDRRQESLGVTASLHGDDRLLCAGRNGLDTGYEKPLGIVQTATKIDLQNIERPVRKVGCVNTTSTCFLYTSTFKIGFWLSITSARGARGRGLIPDRVTPKT